MDKPEYHLVSFSGGKDSTAMLLGMIERGMQMRTSINWYNAEPFSNPIPPSVVS